jgi:DNA-binding protein H-NS
MKAIKLLTIRLNAVVLFSSTVTPIQKESMQDLSNHSLTQLRKLEVQLTEELKKRRFLSISKAREQILHIARDAGISLKELLSGNESSLSHVSKSSVFPVKYRHPDDPTKEWRGRGRKPGWVNDWISSGRNLDAVRVNQ